MFLVIFWPRRRGLKNVPFKKRFALRNRPFKAFKSHFFSPAAGQRLHVTAQILEICRFSGSGFLEMKGGFFWMLDFSLKSMMNNRRFWWFFAAPQARKIFFLNLLKSVFPLRNRLLEPKKLKIFSPAAGQRLHVTAQIPEISADSQDPALEMKGGFSGWGGGFLDLYTLMLS